MPIRVSCNECPFTSTVQDSFAGKRVTCPKCQSPIAVPAPTTEDEDDEPARPKAKAKPRVIEDDEDDAPHPKPKKKRPTTDDEDEDRPKPKKGKKSPTQRRDEDEGRKSKPWLFVGIGAAVLVLGGIGVFLATRDKAPEVAKPNDPQPGAGKETPKADTIPELKPQATVKIDFDQIDDLFLHPAGNRAIMADGGRNASRYQDWNLSGEPRMVREGEKSLRGVMPGFKQYFRTQDANFDLEVLDLDTDKPVAKWPDNHRFGDLARRSAAQSDEVMSVAELHNRTEPSDKGLSFVMWEWDIRSGSLSKRFQIPTSKDLTFGGFANGGKSCVVGWTESGRVQVWDVPSGKLVRELTLPRTDKDSAFNSVAVSSDGKRLLVEAGGFKLVDATTGMVTDTLPMEVSITAHFVPNSSLILARTNGIDWKKNQQYKGWLVYDTSAKLVKAMLPAEGLGVAFSADGKTVATWENYKRTDVQMWGIGEFVK